MSKHVKIKRIKKADSGMQVGLGLDALNGASYGQFMSSLFGGGANGPLPTSWVEGAQEWNSGFRGMGKINASNAKYGGVYSMVDNTIGSIDKALVGDEKTGSTAQAFSGIKDFGHSITSQINPMGGMINTGAKTLGHLIGGTKDRVEGTGSQIQGMVSDGLSLLGPWGMAAGATLNFINGIGGTRVDKLVDHTKDISSEYSGSRKYISKSIGKYSNKKAGLFDFGFATKGNKAIRKAESLQNRALYVTEQGKKRLNNQIAPMLNGLNLRTYSGGAQSYSLAAMSGMKIPELEAARQILSNITTDIQKLAIGGKISDVSVIPAGSLHAHKHNLESIDPELDGKITSKGIPVVTWDEGGEIEQMAEIEKEEIVFRKSFTEEIESLYKAYKDNPNDDEFAITAGKLLCQEILKNTQDNTGLIKTLE